MNELIDAVKAIINNCDHLGLADIQRLRAAVERAENVPSYFMEWWETFPLKTDDVVPAVHAWEAGFTAAQQAERARIKSFILESEGPAFVHKNWLLEKIGE